MKIVVAYQRQRGHGRAVCH